MKKTILLLSFFAALLAACGGHAGEKGSRREATPPVDEDQAVLQLSSYLIAEPQNQAETDQNAIVNYAIDELIPLERAAWLYNQIGSTEKELLTIPQAGHNDILWVGRLAYFEAIRRFVAS